MLDWLVTFLKGNVYDILVVFVLAGIVWGLWYNGKKKEVKMILFHLISLAENVYGSKAGQAKLGMVYNLMPKTFKFLVPKQLILNLIEEVLKEWKEQLGHLEVKECVKGKSCNNMFGDMK